MTNPDRRRLPPGGRPRAARRSPDPATSKMGRIFGFLIGIIWLGLALLAFRRSAAGWDAGFSDVGVWWSIIAGLLAVAALGALVGTWLHTRPRKS